jgi:uncharacterized protein
MSIRNDLQEAMKDALRNKDSIRLDCLRMAKAALLNKEKEKARDAEISDDEAVQALRAEVRKRQQSIDTYRELGKTDEVAKLEREIEVLESFLPRQLDEAQLRDKVRAYLAEHPELNHPGKLTGALKKELGDLADGKLLNQLCREVLEA